MNSFHAESLEDGEVLDLDTKTLVTLTVNRRPISDAKTNATEQGRNVSALPDPVECDADQVIHAHPDKANGNKVVYTSGAIEEPTITQLIVDVLQGTKPAFDLWDAQYEILERFP